jgi:Lamin Tail Domain
MVSRECVTARSLCAQSLYNVQSTHRLNSPHIQVNPIADDDSTEWFEIYNASPDPVNMTGWKIGAFMSETTHTMTSFVIGGGQYKVLGRQANIGGFTADYVYGSTKLKNSVSIALTDNAQPGSQPGSQPGPQQPQASIYYGPGSDFPDFSSSANAGKSMQLKSLTLFSGISANWCQSSTAWPDAAIGDMGTPGKANNCP